MDGKITPVGVDRAAVRANIDIEPRAVPVCNPSLRMDIVGLERAAVDVDRKRATSHFVLNMLRHERSAVQIQYSVSVRALRPFVVGNRHRSAVLRERRRSASLRANNKIAVQRPVPAGLVQDEVQELHIARACEGRIRGIEVAFVEINRLCRRDVDGAKIVVGVVVQVIENKMPRHVLLDNTATSQSCVAADGQMPRLQRDCIKASGRVIPVVTDANKVLVVIAGAAGVVERILVLPLETPVPSIRDIVETQSRIGSLCDIGRKIN